jgi:hypothetical protein
MEKLFSIRDLRTEANGHLAADATKSKNIATPSTPVTSRSFLKEDSSSYRGLPSTPRTPSGQLGESAVDGEEDFMMTPPPPLAPMTPLSNTRGRLKITKKSGESLRIPRRGRRRASTTNSQMSPEVPDGDESRQPKLNSPPELSGPTPIKSILKNRDEIVQVPDENVREKDPEEKESKRRRELYEEVQRRKAAHEAEADLGIEEDVFTHYSWYNMYSMVRLPPEETRQVRGQMKDAIRQTVLQNAFEAIDNIS